jgi:hypothetical protein
MGETFSAQSGLVELKKANLEGRVPEPKRGEFGELLQGEALVVLFTFANALAYLIAPHVGPGTVELGEVEEVLTDNAPLALQGALWELDQDIGALATDDVKLVAVVSAFAEALMKKVQIRAEGGARVSVFTAGSWKVEADGLTIAGFKPAKAATVHSLLSTQQRVPILTLVQLEQPAKDCLRVGIFARVAVTDLHDVRRAARAACNPRRVHAVHHAVATKCFVILPVAPVSHRDQARWHVAQEARGRVPQAVGVTGIGVQKGLEAFSDLRRREVGAAPGRAIDDGVVHVWCERQVAIRSVSQVPQSWAGVADIEVDDSDELALPENVIVRSEVTVADHFRGQLARPPPDIVVAALEAACRVVPLTEPPGHGGEDVGGPQPPGMIVDHLASDE